MKRENKSVVSIIAAVLVSLLAGCASVPSANDDLFADSRTYNGGE
jgi:type IV pilus biogenesis protein CpaD/CtpE